MNEPSAIQLVVHGEGPIGQREWFGTDVIEGIDATAFDDRRTRCYELALNGFIKAPDHSWLVHGSWHGPEAECRIAHAWLVIQIGSEMLMWEPITACLYRLSEFEAYARMWEERRYNRVVAYRLMTDHDHQGPWHESRYP